MSNSNNLFDIGIQNFNNKNYRESLEVLLKISLSNVNDKQKQKINKIIFNCFSNIDLTQLTLKKINIQNSQHVFEVILEGKLNFVEALVNNQIINWDFFDEKGLSPIHHSVFSGDTTITNIILSSGCEVNQLTKTGRTPLELACSEKDPSMIKTLVDAGANPKKHLFIREKLSSTRLLSANLDIIIIILKLIPNNNEWKNVILPDNFPLQNIPFGYDGMSTHEIIKIIIYQMNHGILQDHNITINDILNDELFIENKHNDFVCPKNIIENILYSLCSFINYDFKIDSEWVLNYEILNLANKIKKDLIEINDEENFDVFYEKFKRTLFAKIYKDYVESGLFTENYMKNIVLKWIVNI